MPPVSGIDAESSAKARAPHRTIKPPSTHTPIINIGSGTRVAMPAGVRKMPPPIVMPITRPIELHKPSLRTRVAAMSACIVTPRMGRGKKHRAC